MTAPTTHALKLFISMRARIYKVRINMSDNIDRYVVQAKLLGKEKESSKNSKDYAIDVILSDESQYTIYRSMKGIANFHQKLATHFPVEAGYFNEHEKVIPNCPVRKTPFGIRRVLNDDCKFEKLLNSYIKELPALPSGMIKSEFFNSFFALQSEDMQFSTCKKKKKSKQVKKPQSVGDEISGPIRLKAYMCITDYNSSRTSGQKFSLASGSVVQTMQKDPSGWWLVDASGIMGWAPASFLVPVDEDDIETDQQENEALIGSEKVGARYISMSAYQASRDDELSFVRGAIVRLIKKHVDGWWLVRYNGGEGFVPGSLFQKFDKRQSTVYVKGIQRNFNSRKSTRIVGTMQKNNINHTTGKDQYRGNTTPVALYECTNRFIGRSDQFEISLNKGVSVKVIERKDHGWWYVQDQHGRTGWAPASHLKAVFDNFSPCLTEEIKQIGVQYTVIHPYQSHKTDELTVEQGDKVILIWSADEWCMVRKVDCPVQQGLVPSSFLAILNAEEQNYKEDTSQAQGIETTYEPFTVIGTIEQGLDDDNTTSTNTTTVDNNKEDLDIEDCYGIAANYTKKYLDELTVYEGQIACIIDNTNEDSWYVNVDGKEGWLPSNLLEPIWEQQENKILSPKHSSSTSVSSEQLQNESESERSFTVCLSLGSSTSSDSDYVTSPIDKDSLERIERAIAEAERIAYESQQKAVQLRKLAEDLKKHFNSVTVP